MNVKNVVIIRNAKDRIILCQSSSEIPPIILVQIYTDITLMLDCKVFFLFCMNSSTKMGTFADDTAIFATHADPTTASRNLQEHLLTIKNWLQKWKIKVNETKSSHITFTLRKGNCSAIRINQTILPQVESVKYLGLHFDRRQNWKAHITKKRKQTDLTL